MVAASSYAVEALDESDIVSAINFAREFNVRLVVKVGGRYELTPSQALTQIRLSDSYTPCAFL